MVKVVLGNVDEPWCAINLTEADVQDWKASADIAEQKIKENLQLPPISLEQCHDRDDGDLRWGGIHFEHDVDLAFWHAMIMAVHRIKEEFTKKQKNVKNLDTFLKVKRQSDKRNPKYYV
eukprot:TRINITY_DN1749_c0_g4_i1.p1 TRINITY_DN1749_c0_g4~~TRINITY_DN1749_c0_g4_i1.p1  ORF type:complete len:119 (-),score=21.97 TRINITY_DN1749_c0_g4_i1:57-413(-)